MFEYHGWIWLVASDWDDPERAEEERRENELAAKAEEGVSRFRSAIPNLTLVSDREGAPQLIHMHGCLKHGHHGPFEELFEWAAEHLQVSYGLLYYWNDEALEGDRFHVVRLAAGRCTRHRDELLSPTFEVIDLSRPTD